LITPHVLKQGVRRVAGGQEKKKKKHAYGHIFVTNEELGNFVGWYAVLLLDRLLKRD
jgi:hypothetical protein